MSCKCKTDLKAEFVLVHPDAKLPTWGSEEAAGCDLYMPEDEIIGPHGITLLSIGIIAIPPEGYHWELVLRSGAPKKYPGVVLANSIGIIDSDYCGPKDEIKVQLLNFTAQKYTIKKHQRIAQLVLRKNLQPTIKERTYESLSRPSRGGFHSTGS